MNPNATVVLFRPLVAALLAGCCLLCAQQTAPAPVRLVPAPVQQPQGSAATPAAQPAAQDPQPGTTQPGTVQPAAAPAAPAAPEDPAAKAKAEADKLKAEQDRAKAEAEQKKQQRLQKIRQVKFDRRPTTMLRTWSSPPSAGVVTGDPTPPGAEGQPQAEAPAEANEPAAVLAAVSVVARATAAQSIAPSIGPTAAATPVPGAPANDGAAAPAGAPDAAPGAAPAGQPGAVPPPKKIDPFDQALKDWARAVTLGDWAAVKTFLGGLETDDEKKAAWTFMLTCLRNPPPPQGPQPPVPGPQFFFGFDDVLGLCAAAPCKRDDAAFEALGAILQLALQRGLLVEPLLDRLQSQLATPGQTPVLSQREASKLLFGANLPIEAGAFLPSVAAAAADRDFEGLNLLAKHLIAKNQKEGKADLLQDAWAALQEVFAANDVDRKQKEEALKSAVGLAPRLQREVGQAWFDQSFTRDVQRGMDIIASIGVAAADAGRTQVQNPAFRQLVLQLQKNAVTALLQAAPQRAAEWRVQLGILADNWLREAQISYRFDQATSYGPMMRRDRYGNFFYYDEDGMRQQGQRTAAIATPDVLELQPDARWIEQLEPGLQPKLAMVTAQLWLKVQEEQQAFPHIAALAKTHPPQAKELVDEFLRVWTRNHDPNEGRHNYYFYGYETRADGIPLTRSKQERNLADLAHWIEELRKLPIAEPDQDLLARAFTTCHSSAEVYRLDAIERVFGSMQSLQPRTLAALLEQMRQNLATVWRQPNVQEKARTRRKQKDIEAEVQRGYQVAQAVVADGLQKHAGDWSLLLARANLAHDENDYRREIGNDVKYAERRMAAFADYAAAADAYAAAVPALERDKETTDVYEHWFYAALGSSDLQNVKSEHVPVLAEVTAVRDRLRALPGDAGERHVARFANSLFTRMGGLNPAVKMRYVKSGLDIVGDHKQAFEARKLYDYYKDILGEIQLQTRVDGATTVGHGEPFGVFVELRHTREIERESGGFGRYLRNQNDVGYSYNYGRPTENYRDKFADMAKQQLGEQFDVLSVTFQNDSVHSRATEQYGWRVTPYAYLLLQPRGAQVDRLPSLRLDLDFLDTSGYAVLPIESPTLAIDASADHGPPRPCAGIEVTQILDERQAKSGKLLLEVKATAHGLLPRLDDLLDLAPAGFTVANVDDTGPQVTRFDPEGAVDEIETQRTWNVVLRAQDGLPEPPKTFRFATARLPEVKLVRQRYADADLVAAAAEIELDASYGQPRARWPWYAGGGAALLLLAGLGFALLRRRPAAVDAGLRVPDQVTAFTVLGLLRTIRSQPGLDDATALELDAAIGRVESGFFAAAAEHAPDLHALATDWVARARRHTAAG